MSQPEPATQIIPFDFDGAPVRALLLDGVPHFVGRDVADRLGYADPTNAIKKHCKGVAKHHPLQTAGGMQNVRVIAEPDVLRLIIGSRLPAAERFERWVFEEVLPAIRRDGGYMVARPDETPDVLMARALLVANATMERQRAQLAELAPKAAALDRIEAAEGSVCITDAAKTLGMRRDDLIAFLSKNGWIYKRAGASHWCAYQTRMASGDMEHVVHTTLLPNGNETIREQAKVTAKGLTKLAKILPPVVKDVA